MAHFPSFLPSTMSSGPRYYCHQCEMPFSTEQSSDSPVCPNCQSEFVETFENDPPPVSLGEMTTPPEPAGNEMDTDDPEQEQVTFGPSGVFPPSLYQPLPSRPGQQRRGPTHYLAMQLPIPMSVPAQNQEPPRNVAASRGARGRATTQAQTTTQTSHTPSRTSHTSSQSSHTSSQTSRTTSQRMLHHDPTVVNPPPARRPRQAPPGSESTDGLADLHFSVGMPWYFMLHHRQHTRREQQAAGGGRGRGRGGMLGTPLFLGFGSSGGEFLHSSPGDYVWGPQGIDNMISQMLASLEDPGPPPAEQSKIDALPTVLSTQENMKNSALCSVCKEDFSEGESLLKMPCEHLYHKECILPWLKLHDTCPTCRFHLNTGEADKEKGPVC